ncbi:MAG: four helix bundle protein [Candidatus Magasanikbacteria bacterium]
MSTEGKYKSYEKLDVWKLGHELRLKVYILVKFLPKDEQYGLSSQIKRSSASICANVAEGHGRFHYQENIQFCRVARGSLAETKDHLTFIRDAKLIKKTSSIEHLLDLCERIRMKLNGYIGYLKRCKLH